MEYLLSALVLVFSMYYADRRAGRWSFRLIEYDDYEWLDKEAPVPVSSCCGQTMIPHAVRENFLVLRCDGCLGMWFTPILSKRRN